MDRFVLNHYGNKYNETKKYLHEEIKEKFNFDYVAEPFGGIFGFSRYFYLINPKTKFLINDIDVEMITFYKELKKDFDKTMEPLIKLLDKYPKEDYSWDEARKLFKDNNEGYIARKIFSGGSVGVVKILTGKRKIKNFIEKKEEYKKFFKQCEFYNLPYQEFLNKIKNKKNLLIYFDPPYFNSANQSYSNDFKDDDYHDGTSMYIDILKCFENNNFKCLLVINKIDLINYIFKNYFYKEYTGKYQNFKKSKKHHIIYKNFI